MKKEAKTKTKTGKTDAIALLKKDHDAVKKIFAEYQEMVENGSRATARKEKLVAEATGALKIHAKIEEDVLYPALYAALDDQFMIDEAEVEHDCAKELIAQLDEMSVGDEFFDAKFVVLGELVKHHIKEEEEEIFPKMRKSGLDLVEMGAQLEARRKELEDEGMETMPLVPSPGAALKYNPEAGAQA